MMSVRNFVVSKFLYAKRCREYSIKNLDDIKDAIYGKDRGTVFAASQVRYIGIKKSLPFSAAYDWLAEQIFKYLNDGIPVSAQADYDAWHNEICEGFIAQLARIGHPITYGRAQKFLNIAMKYCYCFGDADTVEPLNKFAFCHVALDRNTYCPSGFSRGTKSYSTFCKTLSFKGFKRPFYSATVNPSFCTKTATAWSKLTDVEYKGIEGEIIEFLRSPVGKVTYADVKHLDPLGLAGCPASEELTPFQVEFLIWD